MTERVCVVPSQDGATLASDDPADLWPTLFPEVADPETLQSLLDRIDGIEPARTAEEHVAPFAFDPAGMPVDEVIFGVVMSRHLRPVFEDTWARLEGLACLGESQNIRDVLGAAVVRASAEQGLRPLLQLLADAKRAGRLAGANPFERFADFDHAVNTPAGYADLQRAFPDLLPRVFHLAQRRLDAAARMFERTDQEWPQICAALDIPPTSVVTHVDVGQGDVHAGGQQVAVLTTDNGRRIVVKPRDIALELQYGHFAAQVGCAVGHDLRVLKAHRSPDFGWIEHAEPSGAAPTQTFFAHVGVHLATLYLLNGSDIHYENLMADGDGRPVVVDAEALFTPYLPGAERMDGDLLGVRATGLLSVGEVTGFEYGALDYRRGGESPLRSWQLMNPGRDDMFLQMRSGTVQHPGVIAQGHRPGAADAAALLESFTAVMQWALRHREQLCRAIEDSFDGRCRYIHRPTMSYALVSRMMTHPRFASHAARRRAAGRVAVLSPPTPWAMVESEIAALVDGDIPAFTVDLREVTVRDVAGRELDAQVREAPIARVLRGIRGLDHTTITQQIDVVRESVADWHADLDGLSASVSPSPTSGQVRA